MSEPRGARPGEVVAARAAIDGPAVAQAGPELMSPELQADLQRRLNKAAGQVQGVGRMIRDRRYCVDVLDQIAAAQRALNGVAERVMRNYLERCVTDAIEGGDPLIYDELMRVIFRHR